MHQHEFPIQKMCRVFRVSRGGYYAWLVRPISQREKENLRLVERIKMIHAETDENYGSPRMTAVLWDEKYTVSRPRVARLMRKNGIRAKTRRKFKVTTNSDHKYPISPNLLKQDFTVNQPGKAWASDITYIPTCEGWLYLTVIIELYNRQIVGWAMSNSLSASETTIPALQHAHSRFQPCKDLIFHSDKGVQYACNEFRKRLSLFQMIQSMSGKGNCYDNAVAESFFSTLKKELVYHRNYITRWQARQSIFEYIEIFYNRKRKHSFLGNMSPEQFMKLKKVA
jgi:transposase InsO family protein